MIVALLDRFFILVGFLLAIHYLSATPAVLSGPSTPEQYNEDH